MKKLFSILSSLLFIFGVFFVGYPADASLKFASGTKYYVPVTITNSQSTATPSNFQAMVTVNSSNYSSYLASNLSNVNWQYGNGNILNSWLESGNSNTSTASVYWIKLPNGIPANSSVTIYYCIYATSVNNFNTSNTGEAPNLSGTFGQYDNGSNVFTYYNPTPSSSGWTISGSAGSVTNAPSGSYFGSTDALYAVGSTGYYLYNSIPNFGTNQILTFDINVGTLGDVFFLNNSSGAGQMARLDGRNVTTYYSGFATTTSWTSWSGPSSGLAESENTWYKYDVVIGTSTASAYIGAASNRLGTLGTLANSGFSISNNGNYLGLIGDGGSGTSYVNTIIVRGLPPNNTMPSASFGSVTTVTSFFHKILLIM